MTSATRAEQGWQMLDIFASFGVRAFDLTETDLDGRRRSFRPSQEWKLLGRWRASLLESAAARQDNIIVRPRGGTFELVQLDDLRGAGLECVRSIAFLILATSAGNHQAWVAVRECPADLARRLRQGSGADPSASGAARIAGSVNFKRKYAPDFPDVSILETTPHRTTSRAELEGRGLLAPHQLPNPTTPPRRVSLSGRPQAWPSYELCLRNAPRAHNSDRADVSRADFTFCLLAIDWGWTVPDVCQRLLQMSPKARQSGEVYAARTAQKAAAAVARRSGGRIPCDPQKSVENSGFPIDGLTQKSDGRGSVTCVVWPRYNRSKLVKITISKENYLKAIAEAESEGESVKASTLSRWLNVTAPAVTMAIKRLKRDALIRVDEESHITLTAAGHEIANRVLNRHHLIERMLTEIFGMEWYKVHEEAEQLEHAVSGDFERRLIEKLGAGEACPHGNRVGVDTPADRRRRGLKTLDESPASEAVAVTSVYERDRRLLEYLEGLGVRPGSKVSVESRNADDTLTLRVDGQRVQLGRSAAQKVWVAVA